MKWAARLLRLYPPAWQERYADEVKAVLEQHRVTWWTCLDLVWNAVDAHWHPADWGERSFVPMEHWKTLRRSNSTIFWIVPASALSYILFLNQFNDVFHGVCQHYQWLYVVDQTLSRLGNLQTVALIAAALVLAGALALQKSGPRRQLLAYVPLACVLVPVGLLGAFWKDLFGFAPIEACRGPAMSRGWDILFTLALLLSSLVLALAVARGEINDRAQRVALVPLGLVALGMALQVVETLAWAIAAIVIDPSDETVVSQFARVLDRQQWPGDWHIWLVVGLALTVLLAGLAVRAVWRGVPALRRRPA